MCGVCEGVILVCGMCAMCVGCDTGVRCVQGVILVCDVCRV